MLNFVTTLTGYSDDSISLKLKFDDPLSISIGQQEDILTIEFVEPNLFISKETGKSLTDPTMLKHKIPR